MGGCGGGWLERSPCRSGLFSYASAEPARELSGAVAHPEEAREPSCGTAQAELGHCPGGHSDPVLRHLARELEQPSEPERSARAAAWAPQRVGEK